MRSKPALVTDGWKRTDCRHAVHVQRDAISVPYIRLNSIGPYLIREVHTIR